MLMKRLFGPTGAAVVALVALLGVHGGAHALKVVNAADTNPASPGDDDYAVASVTYAKETLLKGSTGETQNTQAASDTADKTVYYKIARAHLISAPAEISANAGDIYLVTFQLDGMVFSSIPTLNSGADGSGTDFGSPAAGGALGSKSVTFRLPSNASVGAATHFMVLSARFAIDGDGTGTITRTVLNRALEGVPGATSTKTHTATGIIKAAPALDEMVLALDPEPVAMVETNFLGFGGTDVNPVKITSLGTVVLGVKSPNLRDAQGADDNAANVDALTDIAPARTQTTDPLNNTVTFSGDFSFVKTFWRQGALATAGCGATAGTELRKLMSGSTTEYTDESNPIQATTFSADVDSDTTGNQIYHMCIEADGKTAIPMTGHYTAKTVYKGVTNAAFPPVGKTSNLAMIHRDGTSVSIPFLVSQEKRYRQRISIVNKSGRSVDYSFSFTPETGTTATAGSAATGMVAANSTKVLDSRDVVTVTGNAGRTAATLNLVATSNNVNVGITLVNRSDGSTSLVNAHP